MKMDAKEPDHLFAPLTERVAETTLTDTSGGSDESRVVEEIESLCMQCHEDGHTRLLLTRIPFFREIIIMSFACPSCGFRNSEIQPAGEIQPQGVEFKFNVKSAKDLNRQIVKSDTCVFRLEDVDLEIPPGRGQLSNVEGILSNIIADLEGSQQERKIQTPEVAEQVEHTLERIKDMLSGSHLPFTITANDPAGNSWIEPSTADSPAQYTKREYARTREQNQSLGLSAATETEELALETTSRPEYRVHHMLPVMPADGDTANNPDDEIVENQVYEFPASCPGCSKPCVTNMKLVNIPHFKEVIVMATNCDFCGYRSNEVKTGGEVPEKGRRITVHCTAAEDLSRDILKSESCEVECPQLQLNVQPGTMGGRFTTIEGLLTQIRDDLKSNIFEADGAGGGDSMPEEERKRWQGFFERLDGAIRAEQEFHVILKDPLGGSYVQSLEDEGPDGKLRVEDYERSEEEEDELGLRDMKTEGYEGDTRGNSDTGGKIFTT